MSAFEESRQVPEGGKLDIVVVGAGLGGLAAAISCALSGHSVTVLEAAKELTEVREDALERSRFD